MHDMYSLAGFLASYRHRLALNFDLLVRRRKSGCWPQSEYKYFNPRMTVKNGTYLVPEQEAKVQVMDHFICFLTGDDEAMLVLKVTRSEYCVGHASLTGGEVQFRSINEICLLAGFKRDLPGAQQLVPRVTSRSASVEVVQVNGRDYGFVEKKAGGERSHRTAYYLDGPTMTMLDRHWLRVSADSLLNWCFWLPSLKDPERKLWESRLEVVEVEHDLTDVDIREINTPEIRQALDLIGCDADVSLLEFLFEREIPILLSILRQSRAPISDSSLIFLNKVTTELRDISGVFSDAVNVLALEFFEGFIDSLAADGIVAECCHCRNLFRFDPRHPTKKYCARGSEGRNCAKSARNRQYYRSHQDKIRTRSRQEMRETRSLLRKHGITSKGKLSN
jgi:hypothetical protein